MEQRLHERSQKYQKHKRKVGSVLDSLLELAEVLFAYQEKQGSLQIPIYMWRNCMDRFVDRRPFEDQSETH
jgi:hypothetical protein